MKLVILLALVAAAAARPEDHYDSKFDNFDIDEVINNSRLIKNYAHCFIGDGKCTPEGNDIKKLMPEATQTSCAKCTETQKTLVAKAITAVKDKLPTEYATLMKHYDPNNKYQEELEKFLAKYSA